MRPHGGWSFAADPALSYDEQAVIWRPDLYAQTVILAPHQHPTTDAARFEPARWRGKLDAREGPDGRHAILRQGAETHQILLDPRLAEHDAMAVVVPIDGATDIRLGAAERLLRSLGVDVVCAQRRRGGGRRTRHAAALAAYDDWRAGRSYRQIAVRLYGVARVESEAWRTSTLRDTAIRLARTGRHLVEGGYRVLLQRGFG